MKILMVNKFLYPNGGSETYMFKLGDYLKKRGHEVEYFGMEHEKRVVGNSAESYTANMDFHTNNLEKLMYPFKIIYSTEARKKIRKVLDTFQPQVVHLNNFNFQLTPSIIYEIRKYERQRKEKVRIVYTAHDYQLVCPNHMMSNPVTGETCEKCMKGNFIHCLKEKCIHGSTVKSFFGMMEGYLYQKLRTYKYLDAIICPSRFLAEKMSSNPLFENKTATFHNFIDEVKWKEVEKDDYILYFGRFSKEKGIKTLIEVCKTLPDIPFVFAGTGPLEEEINDVTNIKNMGFQTGENLEMLIRNAKFSIYPSEWYENCPFSVMESLLYGTPVLGADIGGIPELINVGVTGELFVSGDFGELKKKIELLWEDKSKTILYSKNCKEIKFDNLATYCTKLMGIYEA
ncbi:MAG: kanE [Anaerocolumna sp.]|jgi:glycosyltransferase involved in cell wall biosynthesis|nr:kanE [Anaerocolumna sp.]